MSVRFCPPRSSAREWAGDRPWSRTTRYLNDRKNGATLLAIALGHAADALCYCLGEVRELSATMTTRRKSFTIADGREQADERGRSGGRYRTARGWRRALDSLPRRAFARHEPALG